MSVETQVIPSLNGVNGQPIMNGANGAPIHAPVVPKFATGLILPPPEIKSVIDRTAQFVARSANPPQFEDKIRENQRNDPKFSFLNPADPYHAYYRHRLERALNGEPDEEAVGAGAAPGVEEGAEEKVVEKVDVGKEPPVPEFILDLPNISSIDLDTMKLTALFTAKRGRAFLQAISAREARNPQFEFLKPTHSLFGYFNRLVDQYTKVLLPSKEMLASVAEKAKEGARWKLLEDARKYAKWESNKRAKDKAREDEKEAEKIAFAEIDWHDYAIVQTIEFTAADAHAELPPPMSVQEVENMTLAQKRMAAMIMENTAEDVEALRQRQAEGEAAAAAAASSAGAGGGEDTEMQQSDDEDAGEKERRRREEEERMREVERARAIQASSLGAGGPMKIKTDYVPKLGAKAKTSATTTCTICGQQIPVDELTEHMRIELLDPRWKSQRDALEARKAQASELQRGANVVSSLKTLARTRVDIFGAEADEERRKREEEEERERRKEREKVVWDGHTATKVSTQDRFSTNVNFDEQIAAIHRAKGLGPQEEGAIGPGIGPAAVPPPLGSGLPPAPASLPAPPLAASQPAYAAATVSSGPQPASLYPAQPAPVMLPPIHFQGLPPGFGAGGYPGAPPPIAPTGVVRSAQEMEGGEGEGGPPAKRQKVAKLPPGQYYPEQDWINLHPHPINLQLQLPNEPSKPEWKLDGTTITLVDLPLTLLVSTLRERFLLQTGSALPAGRIRFMYAGKMLTNANTIASYNLEEDDVLVLNVAETKKKK